MLNKDKWAEFAYTDFVICKYIEDINASYSHILEDNLPAFASALAWHGGQERRNTGKLYNYSGCFLQTIMTVGSLLTMGKSGYGEPDTAYRKVCCEEIVDSLLSEIHTMKRQFSQ